MKVKSATNPTTSKVSVGSDTLNVSEFLFVDNSNDKTLSFPVVGFTESNTGYTASADPNGLKLTKLPTPATYSLTNTTTFAQSVWAFSSAFSSTLNVSSLTGDFVIQRLRFVGSGATQYAVEVLFSFANQRIEVNTISNDGSGAVFSTEFTDSIVEGVPKAFEIQVIYLDGKLNLYYQYQSEWKLIHGYSIAFGGPVTMSLESEDSSSVSSGEVLWNGIINLPVLAGCTGFNTDIQYYQHPICVSKNTDAASFNVFLDHHKTSITLTAYGSGTGISSSEVYETQSFNKNEVEDQWGFVKSELEKIYVEGDEVYECPSIVPPDEGSIGDILLSVNCCFPDGTSADIDPFMVAGNSFGRVEPNSDLTHSPKILIRETFDSFEFDYGCAFEFQQIMNNGLNNLDLQTTDPDFRIMMLKNAKFGEASRLYYGLVVDPMIETTKDYFFDLSYQWSDVQQLDMLTPYDYFYWQICHEDGTVIQSSGVDITVLNYTSNIPVTSALQQGRYYLEVIASKLDTSSVTGTVYLGTTAAQPIGTCVAAPKTLNTTPDYQSSEQSRSRVYFEVREEEASLIVFYQDPEGDDFVLKYETAGLIDTVGQSLAYFKNAQGNPVFVYKKKTSELTSYETRSNKLYYKELDVTTGVFSAEGYISLPIPVDNLSYVHSFDIGKNDEYSLELFASIGNDDTHKEVNGVSRTIAKHPYGPFVKMVLDISQIVFDGSDIVIENADFVDMPVTSVNDIWKISRPDVCYDDSSDLWERQFFADSVRVTRNEDHDIDVVSVIDLGTRTPVVLMGSGSYYKEIAVPMHFESKDYIENETTYTTVSYYKHVSLGIDSLSAAIAHDGMVYSAATRGGICEIGVIDPSLFWTSRTGVVHPQLIANGQNVTEMDIYRPDFRFENLQTLSLDISLDYLGKSIVDIYPFQQYLCLGVGDNRYLNFPMVFQNGILSDVAYEASMERSIVGSHGNDLPSWISQQGALYGPTALEDAFRLQSLGNTVYTETYLRMLMSDSLVYQHQHLKLDEGYRFHTRVAADLNPLNDFFERSFTFTATGMGYYDSSDLDGMFTRVDARMIYWGDSVECQIYLSKSATWESVYTTSLDPYSTYDFDIVMKRTGQNVAKVGFVIREPFYEGSYRYQDTCVASHFEHYWIIPTNETVEDYHWGWSGGSAVETADLNEFLVIYNMGYGLLKQSNGMFNLEEDTKGGSPYIQYIEDHFDAGVGRWRQFNDVGIFNYQFPKPMNPYIVGFFNSSAQSNRFHYPNGFLFKLNRGTITSLDTWTIQRRFLHIPDFLASKYAPGFWISGADQQEMVIWAKAEDSGLDVLEADTVLIQGANFCDSVLVGRPDEFSPWEDIKNLHADVYHIVDVTVESFGDYATATSSAEFSFGLDQSQTWYYKERVSGLVCEILDVQQNQIFLDISRGQVLTESEATIFSSLQIYEVERTSYPHLGVKILDTNYTPQGHYEVHTVDFGIQRNMPLLDESNMGGDINATLRGSAQQLIDKNIPMFNPDERDRKTAIEYSFQWTSTSKQAFAKMLSLINNVKYNARPVWVINSSFKDRRVGRLCYFSSPFTHEVIVDEDGDIIYNMSTELKGIE